MTDRSSGNADLPVQAAQETLTARRVFGEAYERDGATVIPVAKVLGGAGMGFGTGALGGPGEGPEEAVTGGEGSGGGGGFGVRVRPAGVYLLRDGKVTWHPALDVNRIVLGGQALGAVVAVSLAWALRRRRR